MDDGPVQCAAAGLCTFLRFPICAWKPDLIGLTDLLAEQAPHVMKYRRVAESYEARELDTAQSDAPFTLFSLVSEDLHNLHNTYSFTYLHALG